MVGTVGSDPTLGIEVGIIVDVVMTGIIVGIMVGDPMSGIMVGDAVPSAVGVIVDTTAVTIVGIMVGDAMVGIMVGLGIGSSVVTAQTTFEEIRGWIRRNSPSF